MKCTLLTGNQIADIASELDALGRQIPHTVHQRAAWYQAYVDAVGLQDRTRIFHIYDSVTAQTIGILPLQVELYRGTRFWKMRRLVPLAKGPSDFFNLLVVPQKQKDFATGLAHWLRRHIQSWEQLNLQYIPESSAGWQELYEALEYVGFRVAINRQQRFYKIDTTQDWDDYNVSFLHKKLADMRNRRNRLKRNGIEVCVITITTGIEKYLPKLFEIYHERRQELNQNYATSSPAMHRFLTRVVELYEREGRVLLSILQTSSGEPMAYQLDWLDNGVRYHYKPTFDKQFEQYSPSKILLFETIKDSFANPAIREFNFMRGESAYKTQFTDQSEGYVSLSVLNPWSLRRRGTAFASRVVWLRDRFQQKAFG